MPRLTSRFPSYRRHKANGNAVVSLGGHDYYLSAWKSAESKREYDRFTGEWLASGGVVKESYFVRFEKVGE